MSTYEIPPYVAPATIQRGRPPQPKKSLEAHLADTMPRTRRNFIGVEHFSRVGSTLGFKPQAASRTYGAMIACEASMEPHNKVRSLHKIDPASIGLIICERRDENFPGCPVYYLTKPPKDKIVQVDSLITAAPEFLQGSFYEISDTGRRIIAAVVGELAALPLSSI